MPYLQSILLTYFGAQFHDIYQQVSDESPDQMDSLCAEIAALKTAADIDIVPTSQIGSQANAEQVCGMCHACSVVPPVVPPHFGFFCYGGEATEGKKRHTNVFSRQCVF